MTVNDAVPPVDNVPPSAPPAGESRKLTPEDAQALAKTHEEKRKAAEQRALDAEARYQDAENRRRELEQRIFGQPQGADPISEGINAQRQSAALGDVQAMTTLEIGKTAAQTALENQRMKTMVRAGVKPEEWDAVEQQLLQNPRQSVDEARKKARGPAAEEADQLRTKLAEAERKLAQEQTRVRVPNMSITPAAPPRDAATIPRAEYNAILARGGDEAKQLKARVKSPKGSDGHLEVG